MTDHLDEPEQTVSDPHELLLGHLDYYRDTLLRKLDGLDEATLRDSARLPSGWSPLELVWHLLHVERRWLVWGFTAEQLPDPWGDTADNTPEGRWHVPDGASTTEVLDRFRRQCERSRAIASGSPLHTRAAVGGRFPTEAAAPTLSWILFHLVQEYARHVGQLDVVRELADGETGE
ncbi:MAG TPA: DinB family protein [Streptomyces sp.]|nr:DinB family protein [Streptomyces sp.]